MKKFWLLLLVVLIPNCAYAHFLWIETDCANTGPCVAKLKFGEYPRVKETLDTRLNERAESRMSAHPAAGAVSLPLTPEKDHFAASVTPSMGKIAYLSAIDDESPVVDLSKHRIGIVRPIFSATAVLPGSDAALSLRTPGPALQLLPAAATNLRTGQEVSFKIMLNGAPVAQKATVYINAPNGWAWEGEVADGSVAFTPLWPGQYVADVVVLEEVPGEFKGKTYEAIRHRATLTLNVSQAE